MIGGSQGCAYTRERVRDQRTEHEKVAIDFPKQWLGRDGAVLKPHLLVAGVTGPFVHVLEQVSVNGS